MTDKVDNGKCSARIIMGTNAVGAILPCRVWGEGNCLLKSRCEAGINAGVIFGQCLVEYSPPTGNVPPSMLGFSTPPER